MSLLEKKIIAVLGPTNTGKTHFAIERMLQFESGIIGFPLRRQRQMCIRDSTYCYWPRTKRA